MVSDKIKKIRLIRNIIVILILVSGLISIVIIHKDFSKKEEEIIASRANAAEYYAKEMRKREYAYITRSLGDKVKGSEVKVLIDDIISKNQEKVGKEGGFISIEVEGNILNFQNTTSGKAEAIYSYEDGDELAKACAEANSYDGGENTTKKVVNATSEMNKLKSKISSAREYEVVADYIEEYKVIRIYIGQLN